MNPHHHELQATLDGQIAALRGAQATDNPHPLGTARSRAWSRGWRVVKEKVR